MRAALAPVVGLIGLLGATMVSAQNSVDVVIASQLGGVADVKGPVTIASESLRGGEGNVTEGHYHVNTASGTIMMDSCDDRSNSNPACDDMKPQSWLELRSEVDILLSNRGTANHYYVRYEFNGMVFSEAPPKPEIVVPRTLTNPATTTMGFMVDRNEIEVAYRGREGDSTVIFRLPNNPTDGDQGQACYVDGTNPPSNETCVDVNDGTAEDYLVGTKITLLLPHHLAVMPAREATYGVTVKVFEDLSEAREDDFGADVYSATADVIKLAPAVGPATVEAMLATAEVSTPEDMGGAFRLFVGDPDPVMYGNLAKVGVKIADKPGLDADGGLMPVTAGIIEGVNVTATSDAGNFGFGASFKFSGNGECGGAALALMKPGEDDAMVPLAMDDMNDVATSATGKGDGAGDYYFCAMVGPHNPNADEPVHRQAIPEVGDPEMMNGYMLAVTPTINAMAPAAVAPPAGMAMAAGSIDRNGTTVHISYLSGFTGANQRLVIINRGEDAALFWMNDFQAEGDVEVTHTGDMMLAQGSMSMVPGGSRMVIRVQDNLAFSENPTRTAGTLTVAAPTRDIDVMTIQVINGALDTTVYQHAE